MPTGLLAFDASGHATLVNAPARELFPNLAGSRGEHFTEVLQEVPALVGLVETCLATGRIFRRAQFETVNSSETPKRLGATVAPIDPAAESGLRGVLCLITDITEVTRLREQVALKKNLENLGEMSAGLAHEFKNAMAALHGYAQFLQGVDHDAQGRAAADDLLLEVRKLAEMTTAFLNFARPQALQLEDVSVDELIEACASELHPFFESRRVDCVRSPANPIVDQESRSPATVQGDVRLLRQSLLNLLRNGVEAIPDRQQVRRVTIAVTKERSEGKLWAAISISDTGPGIAASDLQKIFIPFFTTKSQGHGIGLALAHRVITEHGGTLSAANNTDRGATFTIRLPLAL
jgi:signal transduction histidine kinase